MGIKKQRIKIPAICQNGHKSHYIMEITDDFDLRSIKSATSNNLECNCPKFEIGEGWAKDRNEKIELV